MDLAPEEPGAMEFIEKAKDEVVISLAHTASDYDTAKEAIQRGASHATHLYNAMPPLNHRNPGVIGAVRDSETCHAELICDGIHIHPSVIRATFAMFGAKRMILISDSMRATGLNDGDYTLGGQPVKVKRAILLLCMMEQLLVLLRILWTVCVLWLRKSAFRLKQQSCAHLKIRQKKSDFP